MMQSLQNFCSTNWESSIGLGVILLAGGVGMAAKMDSKWGYAIGLVGLGLILYTLKVKNIF